MGLRWQGNEACSSRGHYGGTLVINRDELRKASLDDNTRERVDDTLGLLEAHQRAWVLPLDLNLAVLLRGYLSDPERVGEINSNNHTTHVFILRPVRAI